MEELQQALEDVIGGAENLESCDSEKESVTGTESKLSQSGGCIMGNDETNETEPIGNTNVEMASPIDRGTLRREDCASERSQSPRSDKSARTSEQDSVAALRIGDLDERSQGSRASSVGIGTPKDTGRSPIGSERFSTPVGGAAGEAGCDSQSGGSAGESAKGIPEEDYDSKGSQGSHASESIGGGSEGEGQGLGGSSGQCDWNKVPNKGGGAGIECCRKRATQYFPMYPRT